eukprot:8527467-Alexandrium_andersonii.AAC.1
MSASLVGSEMCIRDSGSLMAGGSRRAHARGSTPLAAVCNDCNGVHTRSGCLLYTSDAADDM